MSSNQKGGVGKTTLTRELGLYLGKTGRKILLVDTDPQGNQGKSLVVEEALTDGRYEALQGEEYYIKPVTEHVDLLAEELETLITSGNREAL